MASRFILPFADVGSGIKPPSGAQLFFFEDDGVTPKDTYSDSAATVPNTNPVIANSVGVFGDIYITGSYKVTLKDNNDVQIFGLADVESLTSESSINDLKVNIKTTLSEAKADTSVVIGNSFMFTDRDNGIFTAIAIGGTANGANIIDHDTLPLQFELDQANNVNVKMFGAVGDGVTDDSAVCQIAIDYSKTLPNAEVYFPKSTAAYIVNDLDLDGTHININASDAYLENNSSNNMFNLGETSGLSFLRIDINRILNRTGAGHIFHNKGTFSDSNINITRITNGPTDKSIFKSHDSEGGSLFFVRFDGEFYNHSSSSTVPAIDIEGATNTCSANEFVFSRADRTGSEPFFSLKCTGSGQNFYNNRISCSYEVVNGGGVHLFGCSNTKIENGNFFDMGTTTKDLILLSSAGGNECRGTIIENVARNAGTLGASLYDLNLVDATDTTVINSGSHTPAVGVEYRVNGKELVVINPLEVSYTGSLVSMQELSKNGSRKLGPTSVTTKVIASGAITVDQCFHLIDTEASAATDDLDTIDGTVAGQSGILQTASNSRDVTLKNGTGNLRIIGGADFTLDRVTDSARWIHNAVTDEIVIDVTSDVQS